MNQPGLIPDRTEFLLGKVDINPGDEIARQILICERAGCTIAGIACNTAHAPLIFERIREVLKEEKSMIKLVNAIDEMVKYSEENLVQGEKIGILNTTGSYMNKLHSGPLRKAGFEIVDIGLEKQKKLIHEAIYHPDWGIKVQANPASDETLTRLQDAINFYRQNGAGAVVLACSEISLVINQIDCQGLNQIKPMNILARSLLESYLSEDQTL